MRCSRCAEIAGGLQILVRALLQKRDLASRAHEVICALMDASKVGLSQVNSTAAALAGLDAIMYYSALLCPDMTASVLERPPNFKDGVTGMVWSLHMKNFLPKLGCQC